MINISLINEFEISLPFEVSSINTDFDDYNKDEALIIIRDSLPNEMRYIGEIEFELFNGWNQIIQEEYFIIKLENQTYNWALSRIYWDDNWEKWVISFDVALAGISSQKEATIQMLTFFWQQNDIDFSSSSNSPYYSLLQNIPD